MGNNIIIGDPNFFSGTCIVEATVYLQISELLLTFFKQVYCGLSQQLVAVATTLLQVD